MRWVGLNAPMRKSRFEKVGAKEWVEEVRAMQRAVREASIHAGGRRERLRLPLVGLLLGLLRGPSAGSAPAGALRGEIASGPDSTAIQHHLRPSGSLDGR